MNIAEKQMVGVLNELQEKYSCFAVKAEFEAEGTRTEELMRLKEICMKAKVRLNLKIGGCEAVRDMFDARMVGVDYMVAPMVESPFSLQKYLRAIDIAFPQDEQGKIEFLINVETFQTVQKFDEMLNVPEIDKLTGVVVGRTDLTGSMNLGREAVNSDKVFDIAEMIFNKAKARKKVCAIGGTISIESLPFLRRFSPGLLDRYETRKVCFKCPGALSKDAEHGILKALEFELLWLKNKSLYYRAIAGEDQKRIDRLEGIHHNEKNLD